MSVDWLFVSFWDVALANFPADVFRRHGVDADTVGALVANARGQALQQLHASAQASIETARSELATSTETAERLRTELEAERRAHAASAGRIQELQRTLDDPRAQSQRQQEGLSADLNKAGRAVEQANLRADAAEPRSMLKIDQERQAKGRAEKQVEGLRA